MGMNSGNGRLQGVGAKTLRLQGMANQFIRPGNFCPVPQAAILMLQQYQLSLCCGTRGTASVMQQHQCQQALAFRFRVG